ncbi:MAG: 5,6-dimethylbenzimidazole synthase [Pseudomonadota bacterium]
MQFNPEEADTLWKLLSWRRDVRHFTDRPIAPEIQERLRHSMDAAPSVGNARPWRVLRVEHPAHRQAVRAAFETARHAASDAYDSERRTAYLALKLAGLDAAPLQLAVFTETEPAEGAGLGRTTMPQTLEQSTAMAIHTLWLAARAENIGLGMVSILEPAAMERLFRVPASWRFSAYLCLGHAAFDDDRPLLHRKDWQHDTVTEWRAAEP